MPLPTPRPLPSLDAIGDTALMRVDDVFVKLECSNPGGSVKDRIAYFMLREAEKRGELKNGDTIVEATSGNTGIALALVGRQMGYRVVIYMPENMTVERSQMMENLGAQIRLVSKEGSFREAIARRDEFRGRAGYYIPDQFANPDNIRCHRLTTGAEILAQVKKLGCDRIDCFVAGVGTGGTLIGVGQALRAVHPNVRVTAVEPTESPVMSGGDPGDHGINGIGDGFVPCLVNLEDVDDVVRVSTDEAHAEAQRIRTVHGHCVGRSAGANMIAALRMIDQGMKTVVTVWPDCADRYLSVGLESPSSSEVKCELRHECEARARKMLGDPA
ncbi:MAG TPA: PLP-dependent cysteine synthase family protein [Candidatus Polarisedimenticolia bacterium]|nr:PLP-dependent cysteine synthase family protein [Candidatus Polarisedimenticolia bacterium]